MTKLVDGKKIADEILQELRIKIQESGLSLKLAVVLVGGNPASLSYIKMKQKRAEEIGIQVEIFRYRIEMTQAELIAEIKQINSEPSVSGILVQLPLPEHLNRDEVLNAVDPQKDVDCLTETNKQRLNTALAVPLPPAAAAVLKILEYYQIDLRDKQVLVIGEGDLIGKPLAGLLKNQGIKFVVANRQTPDLPKIAIGADVIVTGTGKANLLTGDMVKQGATVIDAGTTGAEDGAVVGDVDTESVARKAGVLAAVPGGVGPVTVSMLFANVLKSAASRGRDLTGD